VLRKGCIQIVSHYRVKSQWVQPLFSCKFHEKWLIAFFWHCVSTIDNWQPVLLKLKCYTCWWMNGLKIETGSRVVTKTAIFSKIEEIRFEKPLQHLTAPDIIGLSFLILILRLLPTYITIFRSLSQKRAFYSNSDFCPLSIMIIQFISFTCRLWANTYWVGLSYLGVGDEKPKGINFLRQSSCQRRHK